jgi:HD superfamily phosphohydrolase
VSGGLEVVRDPLWNNIRLDPEALAVLDTPAFQRLRYVRQLGHAFLVYPGATHTRFEHALGTYHLARRALEQLRDTSDRIDRETARHIRLAALLHDIGHYPFSHALEEAGLLSHELLAGRQLATPELARLLDHARIDPQRLLRLIQGRSDEPLAGLISGGLDVDKLDYLSRDALMCGVPYGVIDVDRLLASLPLADRLALHEKGLTALESLAFARYQMYRNVYWHHAVRAATVMFKRLVRCALQAGRISAEAVAEATDDGLLHELQTHDTTGLARALRERRLAKRAVDIPAAALPGPPADWPATDPDLVEQVEAKLARDAGLEPGDVFLDFPIKPGLMQLDVPLVRRDGSVTQLQGTELATQLGLARVGPELYATARRLRVLVLKPARISEAFVSELVTLPAEQIARKL